MVLQYWTSCWTKRSLSGGAGPSAVNGPGGIVMRLHTVTTTAQLGFNSNMPLMEFCAGSNDRCYRCNQLGDPKLRTCSRCRVARYCSCSSTRRPSRDSHPASTGSPQCQSDDWKKHKPNCTDHKTTLKNHPDSSMEDTLKVFVKWLDLWRGALLAWGAFSADLGNRPADYLLNHR